MKQDKKLPPLLMLSPRAAEDPFLNMIHKNNQSPILKPVYVKQKYYPMKACKSQESLSSRSSLPPISPVYPQALSYFDIMNTERINLRTPNFQCSAKKRSNMHLMNISEGQVHSINLKIRTRVQKDQ